MGSDARDGDGAGVMTSIPHKFFVKNFARDVGLELPPVGQYAAGNLFFKPDPESLKESIATFEEQEAKNNGQSNGTILKEVGHSEARSNSSSKNGNAVAHTLTVVDQGIVNSRYFIIVAMSAISRGCDDGNIFHSLKRQQAILWHLQLIVGKVLKF